MHQGCGEGTGNEGLYSNQIMVQRLGKCMGWMFGLQIKSMKPLMYVVSYMSV